LGEFGSAKKFGKLPNKNLLSSFWAYCPIILLKFQQKILVAIYTNIVLFLPKYIWQIMENLLTDF